MPLFLLLICKEEFGAAILRKGRMLNFPTDFVHVIAAKRPLGGFASALQIENTQIDVALPSCMPSQSVVSFLVRRSVLSNLTSLQSR